MSKVDSSSRSYSSQSCVCMVAQTKLAYVCMFLIKLYPLLSTAGIFYFFLFSFFWNILIKVTYHCKKFIQAACQKELFGWA